MAVAVDPQEAFVEHEGHKIPEQTIVEMHGRISGWLANCCGLAGDKELEVGSYGGMTHVHSVEDALAIRIAAMRGVPPAPNLPRGWGTYAMGYVICSSTPYQGVDEYMRGAGFKVLDTFRNPAHGSGQLVTIWGAPSIDGHGRGE